MPIIQTNKNLLPRDKLDFYPTEGPLIEKVLSIQEIKFSFPDFVLDPGAGEGNWGRVARRTFQNTFDLTGVEINTEISPAVEYDHWYTEDFLDFKTDKKFNLIIGNPPFRFALPFVEKSIDLLAPNGYLVFLLRTAFVESKSRYTNLYTNQLNPKYIYQLVQRPRFLVHKGKFGTTSDAHAIFIWRKGFIGDTKLRWLSWR